MRQAVLWGLLGRNPCDAVSVPRPARREMQTLSEAQLRQLFEATADHRLHAVWVLLATTGLRLGEALGLAWADLDRTAGRVKVRRALQRQRGGGFAFVEQKTSRSRRVVHLAPSVVAELAAHERPQSEERERAGDRWPDHGLIFCTMAERPLKDTYLSAVFHDALRRAGLPRARIHDLRHTAATHLLWRGVHPKVVQELLGHSTITVTLDLYSHVVPALHVEVAGHMEALFGDRPADRFVDSRADRSDMVGRPVPAAEVAESDATESRRARARAILQAGDALAVVAVDPAANCARVVLEQGGDLGGGEAAQGEPDHHQAEGEAPGALE
jgi:integrase